MIAIIRISGKVGISKDVENTLFRLRLRKKYACVVVNEKENLKGIIMKIRDYVAYGNIDKETLKELIEKRAKSDKKIDAEKISSEIFSGKKKLKDFGIKEFFRLHPPIKGIKSSKLHYPKGVLGENKEINNLIRRML